MAKDKTKKTVSANNNLFKKLRPVDIKPAQKNKTQIREIEAEQDKRTGLAGEKKNIGALGKEDSEEINPFKTGSERFEDFSSIETRAPVLETAPIRENLEQQIAGISREVADKTEEKVNVTYNAPDYGDEFYKRVNYGTGGNRADDDLEMDITRGKLMQREAMAIEQRQDVGTRDFGARFGLSQEGLTAGRSHDSMNVEEKYVIREKEKRDRTKLPFEN